jgi:Xaa-Pro aminopeptidase
LRPAWNALRVMDSTGQIGVEEYRARQAALRALARDRGLDVVVAWSRGGGTQDHSADVLYLTGFYTHQPFVPDLAAPRGDGHSHPWRWRAAGHAAAVVEIGGPVSVVVDGEQLQDPRPAADAVVVSADPVETVAELVEAGTERSSGREPKRVGLLGGEALAARWARHVAQRLGGRIQLVEADELSWALRTVKSQSEQALLRASGALGVRAMEAAMGMAVPGASEADVAAALAGEVVRGGGSVYDIVLSSGAWAHTLAPSGGHAGASGYTTRKLAAGDLLRIDAYGSLGGYLFDIARSRVVGRPPNQAQRRLLDAVRDSVQAGVAILGPGVTLGEVARRCEAALAASAYSRRHGTPASTMGGAWGHGLGLAFEPPWIHPSSDVLLEEGMCVAIERRIEAPGLGGAQYEDNLLIGSTGAELLTPARSEYRHR